ncbi:hypothetical protein [Nonomuraea diastatica]|uniref:Uncharacterized protein n=1 Tax=Nonomuraea diastatica TaxID=1848329 RepID=A0A4R4WG91_9ACTN|nr:hypothetical protein [Nonomuraea diastatica]TDD16337.1 hypothetical protein E1294_31625 [Nonomuraea diastatica]
MNTSLRGTLVAAAAAVVVLASGGAADAAAYPKYKAPKTFGTTFQADPKHDFTKRIHSRHNGILRGRITDVRGVVAEYEPIKWKKGTHTAGHFDGPPEGYVMAYASPIAKDAVFLSAYGCKARMSDLTVNRKTGLGAKRCNRATLIKRHKVHGHSALITVYKGRIVKVQEIYTP